MADGLNSNDLEQLCREAQQGTESSERLLFVRLTDSFRLFAQHRLRNRAEAEEVVQDALAVIAQKYKDTAFTSSFGGWAHNVLRNTIAGHIRHKAIRAKLQTQADTALADTVHRPVDDDFRRKVLGCLEQVARSNRRFARVLNLHYQGFSVPEICVRLDLKKGYLYVLLARARSMLEACLEMTKE
jgi:RNA polymerase sigma factor (sigma-70 family)